MNMDFVALYCGTSPGLDISAHTGFLSFCLMHDKQFTNMVLARLLASYSL